MKDVLVSMDQAGRIVLPKSVRQKLTIKPGDVLKISINDMAITLTPAKQFSAFVRKGKALVFSTSGGRVSQPGIGQRSPR